MIRNVLLGNWLILACGCSQSASSDSGAGGSLDAAGGYSAQSSGSGGADGAGTTGQTSAGTSASGGALAVGGATSAGSGGVAGARANGGKAAGGASSGGVLSNGGIGGSGGTTSASSGGQKSTPIAVKDLPIIEEMPDPLTMNDGTHVTTPEQWQSRRQKMIQILQDYEYGHIPPAPGNVKATTKTASHRISPTSSLQADYRMLHLTFGPDERLGFDLGIFTPASDRADNAKYPILIVLGFSANESSLGDASAALARGYAVATIPYQQLGADSSSWATSAFFPAYPDYDWRDIAAWAWGTSRAVDYLITDAAIDPDKIMINGVSRLGQAVLLAGALDERIALSAPVAAGAALRFSGKEMGGGRGQGITEIVDQNTYWFGPRFREFRNQTPRLPCDQHWLPALTAPRLFIMANSLQDQYGRAYAAVQTYLAAKPVYDFLGVSDNIGVHFRQGTHGMTAEDWTAVLDFADQYLMKKAGMQKFDVLPPADQTP